MSIDPTQFKHPRIVCPVCRKEVGVNNGKVMYHKWWVRGKSVPCSGVGREMQPDAAEAEKRGLKL